MTKNDTCDVLVMGFGNAAQAAAYSPYTTGAKQVIVLEKAPEGKRGGNTWFSSGAQFRHVHDSLKSEMPLLPHVPKSEFEKIDLEPYTKDSKRKVFSREGQELDCDPVQGKTEHALRNRRP